MALGRHGMALVRTGMALGRHGMALGRHGMALGRDGMALGRDMLLRMSCLPPTRCAANLRAVLSRHKHQPPAPWACHALEYSRVRSSTLGHHNCGMGQSGLQALREQRSGLEARIRKVCAHARTHARTRTRTRTHAHTHAHTYAHARTHTHARARAFARASAHASVHVRTRARVAQLPFLRRWASKLSLLALYATTVAPLFVLVWAWDRYGRTVQLPQVGRTAAFVSVQRATCEMQRAAYEAQRATFAL
jgi:hypothetical protein